MGSRGESTYPGLLPKGVEAFSSIASSYEDWFASPLGRYVERKEIESLERILGGIRGGSAVEIGAGTGHIARHLARRFKSVAAVEPSPAMRQEGMRRTADPKVSWHECTAETLPFEDGSFDFAVFFTSLEFVEDPQRAISEAMRVVRPAGWLVVGFLHALSPWTALYRRLGEQGDMPWCVATFYTREDIERWVKSHAEASETAIYLSPGAIAPYEEADEAGLRAGNAPAFEILRWRI